ncbi:hypothetical protein [Alloalcanivorax xenomutans]|uniref:hypothetical protein n=1 Tax=Alloalcanivorax xenomutans TaxID=1094342 RepID=UPI003C7E60A7
MATASRRGGLSGEYHHYTEYEWQWTIKAADMPKLRAALQTRKPVLAALKQRFAGDESVRLYAFLCASAVPFETFSRIGD